MTVAEIIAALQQQPPTAQVAVGDKDHEPGREIDAVYWNGRCVVLIQRMPNT